ncbi:uncharacterized protein LOC119071008 [Bradysia coprophila]|uniref:uncharacterized protein LOC119071008 n=1 Tax=Bradysia coprophila TaxID=38358 RepID=UPI00187D945B|nr:uncharacterized protein LOC119071008 [Bradysia coprophila]
MKSITVCLIVCAIALNLSLNFANPETTTTDIVNTSRTTGSNHSFPAFSFKSVLQHQYNALVDRINATWLQCNETFNVLRSQQRLDPHMSSTRKCLVDCTLRTMGMITDNAPDDDQYMLYMKQLRLNYTTNTSDMNKKSKDSKKSIFDPLNHQLPHGVRNGTCRAVVGVSNTDVPFSDLCQVLIESYSLAASKCNDLQSPYGDNCDTSWMIMSCMIRRHRGKLYKSPFYVLADNGKAEA